MNESAQFEYERAKAIEQMGNDSDLRQLSLQWMIAADKYKYSYNFTWLGRPIIKLPGDIAVLQEVIWQTKPDLIIETGIAHGGSLILSASILDLIGRGVVLGIDIDIRPHNRSAIESHPLAHRIQMLEGSSTDSNIIEEVAKVASTKERVMVVLDSMHTHKHVLDELRIYSRFVTLGAHLILPDTFIEYFPKGYYQNRPWDIGNNPMTAMRQFLTETDCFEIDRSVSSKALISEAIDGYLTRVR